MEVLQYTKKTEEVDGTGKVAHFLWRNFPMLSMSGEFAVAKAFKVAVHLSSKCMVSAELDGRELSADDAMILVFFHTISAGHVKLHALANWSTNGLLYENAFLRRNDVVTTMYNYFGKTVFQRLTAFFYQFGICKFDFVQFTDVVDHGLKSGIPFHNQVCELAADSEICGFVISVRNQFLNTFSKFQHEFLGVDGEALFASQHLALA